jgi:hypothetical protein
LGATDQNRIDRLLEWLAPDANPGGVVYGTLTIAALLAAESSLRDTFPKTLASAAVVLALYWLAHSYADLLGHRLATGERLTASALWRVLRHDWGIMRGGSVPLLALLICWIAGARQETAVTVALWTSIASLLAFELLAGLRARAGTADARAGMTEFLLEGCVGVALGVGVLALRVIIH